MKRGGIKDVRLSQAARLPERGWDARGGCLNAPAGLVPRAVLRAVHGAGRGAVGRRPDAAVLAALAAGVRRRGGSPGPSRTTGAAGLPGV